MFAFLKYLLGPQEKTRRTGTFETRGNTQETTGWYLPVLMWLFENDLFFIPFVLIRKLCHSSQHLKLGNLHFSVSKECLELIFFKFSILQYFSLLLSLLF